MRRRAQSPSAVYKRSSLSTFCMGKNVSGGPVAFGRVQRCPRHWALPATRDRQKEKSWETHMRQGKENSGRKGKTAGRKRFRDLPHTLCTCVRVQTLDCVPDLYRRSRLFASFPQTTRGMQSELEKESDASLEPAHDEVAHLKRAFAHGLDLVEVAAEMRACALCVKPQAKRTRNVCLVRMSHTVATARSRPWWLQRRPHWLFMIKDARGKGADLYHLLVDPRPSAIASAPSTACPRVVKRAGVIDTTTDLGTTTMTQEQIEYVIRRTAARFGQTVCCDGSNRTNGLHPLYWHSVDFYCIVASALCDDFLPAAFRHSCSRQTLSGNPNGRRRRSTLCVGRKRLGPVCPVGCQRGRFARRPVWVVRGLGSDRKQAHLQSLAQARSSGRQLDWGREGALHGAHLRQPRRAAHRRPPHDPCPKALVRPRLGSFVTFGLFLHHLFFCFLFRPSSLRIFRKKAQRKNVEKKKKEAGAFDPHRGMFFFFLPHFFRFRKGKRSKQVRLDVVALGDREPTEKKKVVEGGLALTRDPRHSPCRADVVHTHTHAGTN